MAEWEDVRNYVKANFPIQYESPYAIGLEVRFEDGRSQKITLALAEEADAFGGRWAKLVSLVAPFTPARLARGAAIAGGFHCGGLAVIQVQSESWITLQDSFPIEDVDVNEIFEPLHTIAATADILEKALTGQDVV